MNNNQIPKAATGTPVLHAGTKRTNSMSSFSSFDSSQTTMTNSIHAYKAARGMSTNDLLQLENKFVKPLRSKPPTIQSSVSSSSLRSERFTSPSLPRSGSMPRMGAFQSRSTSDLLPFNAPSSSAIPNGRKHSLKNQLPLNHRNSQPQDRHMSLQSQHIKQQRLQQQTPPPPEQQQHQRKPQPQVQSPGNPPRRHPQRPHMTNTFTFPNGEVYIPRSKQRNSYTNLHALQKGQRPPQLLSQQHFQREVPRPQQPQQSKDSQKLPLLEKESEISTPSTSANNPLSDQDTSSNTIISNSTSPSPSRNSRSESVSESTPPSSVDDLTFGREPSHCSKSSLNITTAPNLGKIEETTIVETASLKPEDGQSVRTSSTKTTTATSPASKAPFKAPVVSQPATTYVSRPRSDVSLSQPPKRKPSVLKKMLLKVFSRKKRPKTEEPSGQKLNQFQQNSQSLSSKDTLANTFQQQREKKPVLPVATAVDNGTSTFNAAETEGKQSHDVDDGFDQFSFAEGDEDQGINVKSSDDFNSDVLGKIFEGLSMDKPVESKAVGSLKPPEHEIPVDSRPKDYNLENKNAVNSDDEEDQIITFDDMEFIEKLIEYGETSFPDLASPDLGKSQRRVMRSKSIKKKNSIRSLSSSSRFSANVTDSPSTITEVSDNENQGHFEIVSATEPKEPPVIIKHTPSILTKSKTPHCNTKSVGFTNEIFVNTTYPPHIYNRHSTPVSQYYTNPQTIQQIRYEMNEFKKSMNVHEQSKYNTHYFRA